MIVPNFPICGYRKLKFIKSGSNMNSQPPNYIISG